MRGVGKINYSITNDPIAYDSAHVLVNLRASWESEDGTYNAQAFVTNLFRNRSMINPRDTVLGSAGKYNTTEGEGRLWGVKRSEEHTSELQSLMRISYAVFCLKKKKIKTTKEIAVSEYT